MPSISVAKGRGSINHNLRKFSTPNVDQERTKNNIVYVNQSLEEAYQQCFGKVIEEYNCRQKRTDRKIDGAKGYMNQIKNSGNGEQLFYEVVVQIGNMHDCSVETTQGVLAAHVLGEYMNTFQQNNPNLHVFNAVLHLDEQTPHLHIDYIPVANGYKKGLEARNSLSRALIQQGVEAKNSRLDNPTIAWENAQKQQLGTIMKTYRLSVDKNWDAKRSHLTVDQYKAMAKELENSIRELPETIPAKPRLLDKETVVVSSKDLSELEKRAKLSELDRRNYNLLGKDINDARKRAISLGTTLEEHEKIIEENQRLKSVNQSLMSEIYEYREKIADLKWDNESLRSKIGNLQRVLAEVYTAIDAIRNEFDTMRITLSEKQSNLFKAVEDFIHDLLSEGKRDDLVRKIKHETGVSDRIKAYIKKQEPKEKAVRSHRKLIK